MKKKISRKQRKIFLMLIVVFITAVTLAVETYAWFVGLNTASTGNISIAISSADGLELSLNGQYWTSSNLLIKDASHTYITETGCNNANCAYNGNKNSWPTALSPMSSIGTFNSNTSSRMRLYKKKSLSSNAGGYSIINTKVNNSSNEEDGYIAFDLFIRNGKGSAYDAAYDMDSEEDVYLSADSFATTVVSGSQPDYGAANSVRVGFFEVGRVGSSGYDVSTLTGLSCATMADSTKQALCQGSNGMSNNEEQYYDSELLSNTWNIWEPNHASHSPQSVSYFNSVCKKRTGVDSYGDACQPIDTGTSKKTYASNGQNSATCLSYKPNIYDGLDVNGYSGTGMCIQYVYTYKTSDATSVGKDKPSLIKLGGNSITKLRVYIWLEGQDIDNFDIITKNPSVQVKFGFTKDRYNVDTTNTNAMNTRTSTFQDDSWEKIKQNIQNNNTSQYHVGDMRTVRINGTEYRLRLANKSSSDSVCSGSSNSQTACGFVVEFYDAVTLMKMRDTATNSGGYPATNVYTYLNGDLWNGLPDDLKSAIINTRIVSGHGSNDSANFTTTNKLYLLSGVELFGTDNYDTASSTTRQLDYYNGKSVTTESNCLYAMKQYNSNYSWWWLRTAMSGRNNSFRAIDDSFGYNINPANATSNGVAVAPAFRIG